MPRAYKQKKAAFCCQTPRALSPQMWIGRLRPLIVRITIGLPHLHPGEVQTMWLLLLGGQKAPLDTHRKGFITC